MGLTGMTGGKLNLGGEIKRPYERVPSLEEYCRGRIAPAEVEELRKSAISQGTSLADAVMDASRLAADTARRQAPRLPAGCPPPRAARSRPRPATPITWSSSTRQLCANAAARSSASRSVPARPSPTGEGGGAPQFDREKCVHCGACLWNCTKPLKPGTSGATSSSVPGREDCTRRRTRQSPSAR